MNENITVLKDESLGGIEREYREVKRKATVGERIKIIAEEMLGENRKGEIYTVTKAANYSDLIDTSGKWDDGSTLNPAHEEYVVLEPSEIIRIDNERLRMVDRKAAVGERVIALEDCSDNPRNYGPGAVFEVEAHDYFGVDITDLNGEDNAIPHSDYRVLEPVEFVKSDAPTAPLSEQPPLDQVAANIAALQTQVSGLEAKVAELQAQVRTVIESANPAELSMSVSEVAAAVKVAEGSADDMPPSFANMPRAKSLQQIRDEIVERAKADVKALLDRNYYAGYSPTIRFTDKDGSSITDKCDFIVNRKKRTVVALISVIRGGKPFRKGIAKAAPNDVFNAHIGRAIALRCALGLEVPAEYLNVPNPEEPRVGDVVIISGNNADGVRHYYDIGDAGKVIRVEHNYVDVAGVVTKERRRSQGGYSQCVGIPNAHIIDDSREVVGA